MNPTKNILTLFAALRQAAKRLRRRIELVIHPFHPVRTGIIEGRCRSYYRPARLAPSMVQRRISNARWN